MTELLHRRAEELRAHAQALLNQDAVLGVEFGEQHELVSELLVLHPPASYLLAGPPASIPEAAHDPVLHMLVLLAYAVEDTRGEISVRRLAIELARFENLAWRLAKLPPGT